MGEALTVARPAIEADQTDDFLTPRPGLPRRRPGLGPGVLWSDLPFRRADGPAESDRRQGAVGQAIFEQIRVGRPMLEALGAIADHLVRDAMGIHPVPENRDERPCLWTLRHVGAQRHRS